MSTRARVICHGSSETNARRLEEEAKGWSWRVLFSSRLFQSWWESKNRFFGLTTVFWPRCSNFRHHFQLSVADRIDFFQQPSSLLHAPSIRKTRDRDSFTASRPLRIEMHRTSIKVESERKMFPKNALIIVLLSWKFRCGRNYSA